ncbi:hypothetical protein HS088_TW22G00241 [Tripterygium wilfordii]|uniref:Plant-specific domain TIGR01615 family protein n=1 Tax=Tripterygium wilfordii TaxID=458696 RepID=A0A7J7BXF9_TRIWF|nr:uncharacterized protein LOC119991880 [Tripterygium wilfordii]KAF5726562.1 hypothetical protein HS088_TW22G00241 [Tripterygium wilfordii]
MAGLWRAKRVTDPLDDKARARLFGGHGQPSSVSSGSEHPGDDSPCLSELLHGFLEQGTDTQKQGYDSDSDRVDSVTDSVELVLEILKSTINSNADSYKNLLFSHVLKAVEVFSCLRSQKTMLRRNVMGFLREFGHNAAICKSKWDSSGGITAGSYEYLDVVIQSTTGSTRQNRYIIDLHFGSEFEIARPTSQYSMLMQSLPMVFVGRSEDLKRIVRAMCDATRRSLKSRDLSIPPWRKNRYMQNKWFSPYRRTTNLLPANTLTAADGVKCRFVEMMIMN